mgnify:CR=1 FL=1|nr:MAG TPA: tail completion protein [Caudoviricetes sp.]
MIIEKTIRNYLSTQLDCPVYADIPETLPERCVLVKKAGSGRENYIRSAMIALQSYGKSLYEAAELNELVKNAMDNAAQLDCICSSSLNSDYPFNDDSIKRHRYQAVYDIVHY